jgi:hypothetical protein
MIIVKDSKGLLNDIEYFLRYFYYFNMAYFNYWHITMPYDCDVVNIVKTQSCPMHSFYH